MIRILLIADHELVRASIKLILRNIEDVEVIADVFNGENAIMAAHEIKPDIVLIDLTSPGIGGLEVIARMASNEPSPKILIISAYTKGFMPICLLELGADGFLNKHVKQDEMQLAIQTVYAGKRYITPSINDAIASYRITSQNDPAPITLLTERQLQILSMVASGIRRSDIAKSLSLSQNTISAYMYVILKKLNVKTEDEAVRIAIESVF